MWSTKDDGLEPANAIQSYKWIRKNSDIDKPGKKNKWLDVAMD